MGDSRYRRLVRSAVHRDGLILLTGLMFGAVAGLLSCPMLRGAIWP